MGDKRKLTVDEWFAKRTEQLTRDHPGMTRDIAGVCCTNGWEIEFDAAGDDAATLDELLGRKPLSEEMSRSLDSHSKNEARFGWERGGWERTERRRRELLRVKYEPEILRGAFGAYVEDERDFSSEEIQRVDQLVLRLKFRLRRVIYLWFYEQKTEQEIADIIGVSRGYVGTLKKTAIRVLKNALRRPE